MHPTLRKSTCALCSRGNPRDFSWTHPAHTTELHSETREGFRHRENEPGVVTSSSCWQHSLALRNRGVKEVGNGREHPYYVVSLGRDCLDAVRIPDDQVGIGAHGNAALARVQVEDFGGVCAGHSHELVLVHLASHLGGHHRSQRVSQPGAGSAADSQGSPQG